MTTTTYKEYIKEKTAFFGRHDCDFHCDTTPMDNCGRYLKSYDFVDGAQWVEVMSPEVCKKTMEVVVKKCVVSVEVEVEMLRTEYYSTDDACSKFYFEKF